jgi:hypothetical protein
VAGVDGCRQPLSASGVGVRFARRASHRLGRRAEGRRCPPELAQAGVARPRRRDTDEPNSLKAAVQAAWKPNPFNTLTEDSGAPPARVMLRAR